VASPLPSAASESQAPTASSTRGRVTCYRWIGTGHYACDCPVDRSAASSATTLLQHGLMLAQGHTGIDPSWSLLDSQSTISVFQSADMLKNIRPSNHVLRAVTNGGFQESKLVGDFPNLGKVWFNLDLIAYILSPLSHIFKVYRVTMDTADKLSMTVHHFDGTEMKFCDHDFGLYVFSPTDKPSTPIPCYPPCASKRKCLLPATCRKPMLPTTCINSSAGLATPSSSGCWRPVPFLTAPLLPPMPECHHHLWPGCNHPQQGEDHAH
jgi:hypothetical protein